MVPTERARGSGHKLKHVKFHLNTRKYFLLCCYSNTGTGCPEMLRSLHSWRCSKPVWAWSWATCFSWSCLSWGRRCRGCGIDDFKRSLSTSVILLFSKEFQANFFCPTVCCLFKSRLLIESILVVSSVMSILDKHIQLFHLGSQNMKQIWNKINNNNLRSSPS